MFDTHCHLNFKAFKKNVGEVIERARESGVDHFIVPGTDLETSKKAIEIAQQHEGVYVAVGIHPHHAREFIIHNSEFRIVLYELEKLLIHPKVVAVGEIGLDKHQYTSTKYQNYEISQELVELQKELLIEQIKLAVKYKKTVILHNWEAIQDILELITNYKLLITNNKVVFHCCEPDDRLLDFAIKHGIFIGIDGDVTYSESKQRFVKKIPLELLVLETDSPYLLPEPLRAQKKYPNEPKNILLIAECVASIKNVSTIRIIETTKKNAKKLFSIF